MTSPFDIWAGLWRSGMEAAQTGMRLAELMVASGEVVESRSSSIAAAMRDPLNGDYRELGRMVPEKVDAFTRAGTSLLQDMAALQASSMAGWSQAVGMMMAGRPSSAADAMTVAARSSEMLSLTVGMTGRAVAPIHKTTTANARRLRRRGK